MLEPSRPNEPSGPDVVVGVPAEPDRMAASEAALALESGLKEAFPGRPALAVVLTGEPNGAATPEAMLAPAEGGRPPAIYTGGHTGPEAALPTLLEIAVARDAPACALLEALPRPRDAGWLRALLEPVLAGGYDLVVPSYARGRLEGVLVTGHRLPPHARAVRAAPAPAARARARPVESPRPAHPVRDGVAHGPLARG